MQSDAQAAQAAHVSVYDFLYLDQKRVGSFLAQFDLPGVPMSVKQVIGTDDTQTHENGIAGEASIPGFIKGQGSSKDINLASKKEGTEQLFDPLWVNAISLLTHLQQRDMVHRSIGHARMGQFVLASGALGILDFSILKMIWEIPNIREAAEASIAQATDEPNEFFVLGKPDPKKAEYVKRTALKKQAGATVDLVARLPHSIQARILTADGFAIYSNITDSGLVGSATDLALKHGAFIPGEWHMLGLVDALPDNGVNLDMQLAKLGGLLDGPFTPLLTSLLPMIRGFGRPENAYGVTPLVIFREVMPSA